MLKKIKEPNDLKKLKKEELPTLAEEIREEIIKAVSKRGGHLASNLGAVELTIGTYLALNMPDDKVVWDVGHQCYTHKLLTGRQEIFQTLRSYKGMSGFPNVNESIFDVATTGHASASISTALGLAKARDIKKEKSAVVAIIGDGSLTGGLAFEGLNQAGQLGTDIIIILNDNEMSISENVGALSKYLNKVRNNPEFRERRKKAEKKLESIPTLGGHLLKAGLYTKKMIKKLFIEGRIFEELGFRYIGPIDGHDILEVEKAVRFAKKVGGPVLIHAVTLKGKGYGPAEDDPSHYHGISPKKLTLEKLELKENFLIKKEKKIPTYTEVFGDTLVELAAANKDIVAITAAMTGGTGLVSFSKKYPKRFFDVGIAEGHAVTFASGLATSGLIPVVAIYSTFLQRAYDHIMHDVALSNKPVIFAIDRAGLVGDDGPTHHGVFDLSFLKTVPGMVIMAPSNEQELRDMLFTAIEGRKFAAIRFPRGEALGVKIVKPRKIPIGKANVLVSGKDVLILAVGRMVKNAIDAAKLLAKKGITSTIVDVRFVKPFDQELFKELIPKHKLVVTIEENGPGGFSESISKFMKENNLDIEGLFCHIPDQFIEHGNVCELLVEAGLDAESLTDKVLKMININKINTTS